MTHLHLFSSIPPQAPISPNAWVEREDSIQALPEIPYLPKKFCGQHLWENFYCRDSVNVTDEVIMPYIENSKTRSE
ncbi:MAG: transposase [Chloracidobacterium sp.]|nr:transposase [Chloracidobacterium sp.]